MGMWALFALSFQKQLTAVFGYDTDTARAITKKAKPEYRKIIAGLPEFEKADRFKMNIVNCAMIGAFILSMPERPDVERLMKYYAKAMMTKPMKWFCRKSGKSKFTEKDIAGMKAIAALKAADRNPYSWNMEFYEYPDSSGYEGRFTKCGICALMQKLGLYDLTPAAEYICAYVRGMLQGGFLHTTSERGEGYIAYKLPKEKLCVRTLWPIAKGMLRNSTLKRLVREKYQGQGYMRKVMDIAFAEGDRLGVPVILETDAKSKCDKYVHLGMELDGVRDIGEIGKLYDLIKYPEPAKKAAKQEKRVST